MRVWRIARAVHTAFDGEGARLHGGRWTPRGFRAVYTSATLSLAVLERFVNTDPDLEPTDLIAIPADVETDLAIDEINAAGLPADWRAYPAPMQLAALGERWLRDSRTAVLSVPSAIVPQERNFVLNPTHADFATIMIGDSESFTFDPRMWKGTR